MQLLHVCVREREQESDVKPEWMLSPSPPVVEMDCSPSLQPEMKVMAYIRVSHISLSAPSPFAYIVGYIPHLHEVFSPDPSPSSPLQLLLGSVCISFIRSGSLQQSG